MRTAIVETNTSQQTAAVSPEASGNAKLSSHAGCSTAKLFQLKGSAEMALQQTRKKPRDKAEFR